MSDDTVTGAASPSEEVRPSVPRRTRDFAPPTAAIEPERKPAVAALPNVVGAAKELAARIRKAQAAGYRVQMGFSLEALDSIAVSETAASRGETMETVPTVHPDQDEPIVQG